MATSTSTEEIPATENRVAAHQLLLETCGAVLADENICAIKEQTMMMESAANNIMEKCFAEDVDDFAKWLYSTVLEAVKYAQSISGSIDRERLWVKFHELRSTSSFQENWETFLVKLKLPVEPLVYQHFALVAFKTLTSHLVPSQASSATEVAELSSEEMNSLNFVGGYLVKTIAKEREDLDLNFIVKSSKSVKNDSEDWQRTIDRGGLIYVCEDFVRTLNSIEMVIRGKEDKSRVEFNKEAMKDAILDSSDVLFNWMLVSSSEDDDDAAAILDAVVDKYLATRGFSFAKAIMETFKQESKKSTEKSKPLRKNI